ncbi:MAG: hypothetical protein R2784_05570 [Saprospiraceae bacterium]
MPFGIGLCTTFLGGDEDTPGWKSIGIHIYRQILSMSALSEDVSLLEKAKIRAKEIVEPLAG